MAGIFATAALRRAVAAIAARTAATAAATLLKLYLILRSIAHRKDRTLEAHILAGERMVEIHLHILVGHFTHHTCDTKSVLSHHRKRGAGAHCLAVKLPVLSLIHI